MHRFSDLIETKSLINLKYMVRLSTLLIIFMLVGYRELNPINRFPVLDSIDFLLCIFVIQRSTIVHSPKYDPECLCFSYKMQGKCTQWFYLFYQVIQITAQLLLKSYIATNKTRAFDEIQTRIQSSSILSQILSLQEFQIWYGGASFSGILTSRLWLMVLLVGMIISDWNVPNKIFFSHLHSMKRTTKFFSYPVKVVIFVSVLAEFAELKFNSYSGLYIILTYFLFFNQIGSFVGKKRKLKVKTFILWAKQIVIFCFLIRIVGHLPNKDSLNYANDILEIENRNLFITKFMVFCSAVVYFYLKGLLNGIKQAISIENPNYFGHYIAQNRSTLRSSHFQRYFLPKIGQICGAVQYFTEKRNHDVKKKALKTLFAPHPIIKRELKRIQIIKELKLGKEKSIFQNAVRLIFALLGLLFQNLSNGFQYLLFLMAFLHCARDSGQEYGWFYYRLYDFALLFWCLQAFLLGTNNISQRLLIQTGLFLVFPCFIVCSVISYFFKWKNYHAQLTWYIKDLVVALAQPTVSSKGLSQEVISAINSMASYRLISFIIFTLNIFVQILKSNLQLKNSGIAKLINNKKGVSNRQKKSLFQSIVQLILSNIIGFSRVITLLLCLGASLVQINIQNTILMVLSLALLRLSSQYNSLWEVFYFYQVVIFLVLYFSQMMPFRFMVYNHEFFSLLGFSKVDHTQYERQFLIYYVGLFFSGIFNRYKDLVVIGGQRPQLPAALDRFVEKSKRVARTFFYDYMIWVYYMTVFFISNLIISNDLPSLLLIVSHVIIFLVNIYIYWRNNTDSRNTTLRCFWQFCFFIVIFYVFMRYLRFYFVYSIIRNLLGENLKYLELIVELDLKPTDLRGSDLSLNFPFAGEFCLLFISLITFVSLSIPSREAYIEGDDEMILDSRFISGLGAEGSQGPVQVVTAEKLKAIEDFKNKRRLELKNQRKEREAAKEQQKTQYVDPDNLFASGGTNLMYVVVAFLILRSVFFSLVVWLLTRSIDLNDGMLIGLELLFFNLLFWNIASLFRLFAVPTFISSQIEYFKVAFVRHLDYSNAFQDDFKGQQQMALEMLRDNRHYMRQLLKKIVQSINTFSYWISPAKLIIVLMRIVQLFLSEFLNRIYSDNAQNIAPEKRAKARILLAERQAVILFRICVLVLTLAEMLFVKNYLTTEDSIEESGDGSLAAFIVMVSKKLDYLCHFSKVKLQDYQNIINKMLTAEMPFNEHSAKDFFEHKAEFLRIQLDEYDTWKENQEEATIMALEKRKAFWMASAAFQPHSRDQKDVQEMAPGDFSFGSLDEISSQLIKELEKSSKSVDFSEQEVVKPRKVRIIQAEGVSDLHRFLFIYRNSHKLNFCYFLNGVHSMLRRVILIPLLYHALASKTGMNLAILVPCFFYAVKDSATIETDLKTFMPIFSAILGIFIVLGVVASGDGKYQQDINTTYQTINSSYALVVDLSKIVSNSSRSQVIVQTLFSSFFVAIALSVSMSIYVVYFICQHVFLNRKRVHTLFFFFEKRAAELPKLFVNFKEWKKSKLFLATSILKVLLNYSNEIFVLSLLLLNLSIVSAVNVALLPFTVVTIIFYRQSDLKSKFTDKLPPSGIGKVTFYFILLIFLVAICYNVLGLAAQIYKNDAPSPNSGDSSTITGTNGTNGANDNPTEDPSSFQDFFKWLESYNQNLLVPGLMAFFSLLLRDLSVSEFSKNEKKVILSNKALKRELVALCSAYSLNEDKIYERVKTICKMRRLADNENSIWRLEQGVKDLDFDCKYWHRELGQSVETSIGKLRGNYLTQKERALSFVTRQLFTFLSQNTSPFMFEDTIQVMLRVFEKNSFLVEGHKLDIREFYSGGIEIYFNYLEQIEKFYQRLRTKKEGIKTRENLTYERIFKEQLKPKKDKEYQQHVEKAREMEENLMNSFDSLELNNSDFEDINKGIDGAALHISVKPSNLTPGMMLQTGPAGPERMKLDFSSLINPEQRLACKHDRKAILASSLFEEAGRQDGLPLSGVSSAADLLFEKLTAPRKSQSSFREWLMNVDSFDCYFGVTEVAFINVSTDVSQITDGYSTFKLRTFLKVLSHFLISNLESLVAFWIILIQVYQGALENFVIIYIIIFSILIEDNHGYSKSWKRLSWLYIFKALLKYLIQVSFYYSLAYQASSLKQNNLDPNMYNPFVHPFNLVALLFGTLEYRVDLFVVVLIFILETVLQRSGTSSKRIMHYEDPGTAVARLLLSKKKGRVYDAHAERVISRNHHENAYIQRQAGQRKQHVLSGKNFKLDFIKQIIQVTVLSDYFRGEFQRSLVLYFKRSRNDLFKATSKNIESFKWRVFSYYARLRGVNLNSLGTFFLFLCGACMVIVIPSTNKEERLFVDLFIQNQIMGLVTFVIIVFSVVLISDGVINKKHTHDITGIKRTPFFFRQLSRMNIKLKPNLFFKHPNVRLRRAVLKLRTLFILKNYSKNHVDPVQDNPMQRKYRLATIFFGLLTFITYFLNTQNANSDSNIKVPEVYFCYFSPIPGNDQCRSQFEWTLIRLCYLSGLCYVLVAVVQVRQGRIIFDSFVKNFNPLNKMLFNAHKYMPFAREFGILTDFLSNKSAMQISHKLDFDDILHLMTLAKYEDINRSKNSLGTKSQLTQRIVALIIVTIGTCAFLFGPLVPFVFSSSNSPPLKVKSASMRVSLQDLRHGIWLGDLFYSSMNLRVPSLNNRRDIIADEVVDREKKSDQRVTDHYFKTIYISTLALKPQNVQDRFFQYRYEKDIYGITEQLSYAVLRLNVTLMVSGCSC